MSKVLAVLILFSPRILMPLPAWFSGFFPANFKTMVGGGEPCGLAMVGTSIA